jgi:hypothetical protein
MQLGHIAKDFYMRIPTEPGARCKQKTYRLSLKEYEALKRRLAVLLEQGIVRRVPCPTDYLSPVLFVPKPRKPDELRMCVYFLRLNSVTQHDYHALRIGNYLHQGPAAVDERLQIIHCPRPHLRF